MSLEEVPGGTRVAWTTRVGLSGPLGDVLVRWMAKPVVGRLFGRILDSASTALTGRSSHV